MTADEFQTALKKEKIVIGSNKTLRNLRAGKTKKIFLSSTCPTTIKNDITYYSKINDVPVVQLEQPSDELALICKKKFHVNVVSC